MDQVNHPSHYASACPNGRKLLRHFEVFSESDFDRECDQVLVEYGWDDDAYLYNAAKYLWRCESKGSLVTDLKKAAWYLHRWQQVRCGDSHLLKSPPVQLAIEEIELDIARIEDFLGAGGEIDG